ncbi:MAG: helix-turn-helix domain-containing protein [Oscillospiraceae bacterium]|nr:helix-turn-helix domain-containing protein [Oscillospiraceae bacterium]
MDTTKIGSLIRRLRIEKGLTQLQLAEQMNISDKTVSKWERGMGCPDVSLLSGLSGIFEVDLEKLLSGELEANDTLGGNMKKLKFYVCPDCGNVITALADTAVSCCGKKLKAIQPQPVEESHRLTVERVETEFYLTSEHPMSKEHYISFVALLTMDTLILRKQYPEWDLQTRLPGLAHGTLLWYCNQHGLFSQRI